MTPLRTAQAIAALTDGFALTSTGASIEAPQSSFSGNLNTIEVGGVFTAGIIDALNAPAGMSTGMFSQFAEVPGWDVAKQFAASANGTTLLFRVKWGGGSGAGWSEWNTLWSSGNDGAGSGLDADTLDGLHANQLPGTVQRWLVYDQKTNAITDSAGISSVTDHGTGKFTVTFTTAFGSSAYVPMGMVNGDGGYLELIGPDPEDYVWTASAIRLRSMTSGAGSFLDCNPVALAFAGGTA
jgi:hypothetical protein